jgi:hypothetical protein
VCLLSKKRDMDHYIVKVYRRDKNDPQKIVGQIQHVSTECERPFAHIEELSEILKIGGSICRRRRKKQVIRCRRKPKETS